jgi:Family of unknown function (DUF6282)
MDLKPSSRWFNCLALASVCAFLLVPPARGQELNLKGAIDIHNHQDPDSSPRAIDADDLARLAKSKGMRGIVFKSHYEPTASMAYLVRKEVPDFEIFGGITQDLAEGGINLESVKHMAGIKGGYGRIVWLPTFDAEHVVKAAKSSAPYVPVSKDGHLLPGVLELIDFIAQHHQLVFETGHVAPEEGLMAVHEAHVRGVKHIVVTHAMATSVQMSIPQMKTAAQDGAFIEFVYGATQGASPTVTISDYAKAIREIGPKSCILATDYGSLQNPPRLLEPDGLLEFMQVIHKEGISVDDINLMVKTNPAILFELTP